MPEDEDKRLRRDPVAQTLGVLDAQAQRRDQTPQQPGAEPDQPVVPPPEAGNGRLPLPGGGGGSSGGFRHGEKARVERAAVLAPSGGWRGAVLPVIHKLRRFVSQQSIRHREEGQGARQAGEDRPVAQRVLKEEGGALGDAQRVELRRGDVDPLGDGW